MKLKTVICNFCKISFERNIKHLKQNEKRGRGNYCSQTCVHNIKKINEQQIKCDFCEILFFRKPAASDQVHNFCSHKCSAKYTHFKRKQNKDNKIIKSKICKSCNNQFLNETKTKFCDFCKPISMHNISKGALFAKRINWGSARSTIQKMARNIYFSTFPNADCNVCKYKTHVEVAHKKSVSSFSDDVLLSTINDISNLVGLCPNHHWEYDNGLLTLKDI